MPTAYTTMLLGDGSIAASLVDNTNYQLLDDSWSPTVSSRRFSRIAGKSIYEDVIESISLVVRGTTAAIALSNLAKLTQLMDIADQFRDGNLITPVTLKVQPQGSVLTNPLTAMVLGRPPDAISGISLPMTFNDYLGLFEIAPVTLRFVRSGLWYGDEETPDASAAAANPNYQTVLPGTSPTIPGPTIVTLQGFDNDAEALSDSYLFIASDSVESPNAVDIVEGESGSEDAGVTLTNTSTADASTNARAGSFARISTPNTSDYDGISYLLNNPVDDKSVFILMCARNNSSSVTWYVYATTKGSDGREGTPTEIATIDGTNNEPQIIPLGICYNSLDSAAIRLYIKASSAFGSPTLDIDYIAIIGRDNAQNYVVHIIPGEGVTGINEFTINPSVLTDVAPKVYATDDTALNVDFPLGYDSDIWIATNSDEVRVAWFACRDTFFRWTDNAGAVLETTLQLTRRLGYLTPQ